MKKKIKWIIGIIVVLILAFLYAHIAKMNMIYDKNVDNSEYVNMGAIGENRIKQSFVSVEDTLDGIYIKCQMLGDISGVKVRYAISDKNSGEKLTEGSCKASELQNTKFNKLLFNKIDDCKNKELVLTIWSESATETDGVTFYYQPETEEETQLVIDQNETQGTLIMKTITNRFDFETFCVLLLFVAFITGFLKVLYKLFE